jgi:hypothetical protein
VSTSPEIVFSVPGPDGENLLVALALDVPEQDLTPVENLLTPAMLDLLAQAESAPTNRTAGPPTYRPRHRPPSCAVSVSIELVDVRDKRILVDVEPMNGRRVSFAAHWFPLSAGQHSHHARFPAQARVLR